MNILKRLTSIFKKEILPLPLPLGLRTMPPKYKIALIVPCYERPERTLRAIQNVLEQDLNGWECYFAGDNCPFIQSMVDSGEVHKYIDIAKNKGNKLAIFNLPIHYGGWGYQCRNLCVKLCSAEYVMYMDNDDTIEKNHFSSYYNEIVNTELDFVYFNTWIDPIENANSKKGRLRDSKLEHGSIGHQEIIVKSSVLKQMPLEKEFYGHDWKLIETMLDWGATFKKSTNQPTYNIMGVGELRENNIN